MQGTMLVLEAAGSIYLVDLVLEPRPTFVEVAEFKCPGRHSWGGAHDDPGNDPPFEDFHRQPAYWAPDDSGVLLHFVYQATSGPMWNMVEVSAPLLVIMFISEAA